MSLENEIDKMRKEIRTDGYPMSIGEWFSMYEKEELDIHPEFQRFFRWDDTQKSRFVESIILGIPIPPIFVSQRKDGVWDVVDGLQRLSTLFQFAGLLKDENGKTIKPLVLEKTTYLPSLEGKQWDDEKNAKNSLTPDQRLLIKRSKISVSIILRESDEVAKFELFQRLNTGGSSLTPQEVRNCMLVMANNKMFKWLKNLANHASFLDCVRLSDDLIKEQYNMELALRFLVFSKIDEKDLVGIGDVGVFLTTRMIDMAKNKNFNYKEQESIFKRTFDYLNETLASNAFRKYSWERKKHIGGFVISPYEVMAFGLGYHYDSYPSKKGIENSAKNLWKDKTFISWSGSGINAARRLPKLIPLGREIFKSEN